MDSKWLDTLEEQVQVEYEERMAAIKTLRGVGNGVVSEISPAAAGGQRRIRISLKGLTDEEKRLKKAEYNKAYNEKRKAGLAGRRERDTDKGISASKFKKFLHKGPISQGGTGEE